MRKIFNTITTPIAELTERETAILFATWLKSYTHEVITSVLSRKEEILKNEFAMKMLVELHNRSLEEENDFENDIFSMIRNFETFSKYDPHNHPLTHARSYRDILYDMYIK